MEKMKKILLFLLILVPILPAIEKTVHIPKERPLTGAFTLTTPVTFSLVHWFSGTFQTAFMTRFNETMGYKPFLVRLFNHISISVFHQDDIGEVTVGKSGYLFQDNYIYAYTGRDKNRMPDLMKKLKNIYKVQQFLEKNGVHFILVFAPNKARIFPEFIPARYLPEKQIRTNYDEYLQLIRWDYPDLHLLDMNNYFLLLKKKVSIPLYSKGGTHWSNYALYRYFMDTLVHRMAFIQNQPSPVLHEDNLRWSYNLSQPDDDLRKLMNSFRQDDAEKLPYADFSYSTDPGFVKPKLLVIADSYYSMIYSAPVFNSILSRNNFWYYNKTRYPEDFYKGKNDPIFLRKDLLDHDFVVLMGTEMNIDDLFGFPEDALSWLGIADSTIKKEEAGREARVQYYIALIRQSPEWLSSVKTQAIERHKPLDEVIRDNAMYMEQKEHEVRK